MAVGSFFQQVKTLTVRNFLLKWREKYHTLLEILLPALMLFAVNTMKSNPVRYESDQLPIGNGSLNYNSFPLLFPGTQNISVTPNTSDVAFLMDSVDSILSTFTRYFPTEKDLEANYQKNPQHVFAAVIFPENIFKNGTYTIRFPSSKVPDSRSLWEPPGSCIPVGGSVFQTNYSDSCPALLYFYNGFSFLQAAIDSVLIRNWTTSTITIPSPTLQLFPKKSYTKQSPTWLVTLPLYIVIGFSMITTSLTISIVKEKEKKIKDGMLMMGMKLPAYWTSWFLTEGSVVVVTVIVSVIVARLLQLFPKGDLIVIFLIVFLFGISLMMLAFLITPFFNNHKVAGTVSYLLTLILSLFFLISIYAENKVSTAGWYGMSLLSPAAFSIGMKKVVSLEATDGLQLSNLFEGDFSVGSVMIMLIVDIVLYAFLAYYLDNVIPGEFGSRHKPWFLFTRSFWCPRSFPSKVPSYGNLSQEPNENIEAVPLYLQGREAIRVFHLKKIFRTFFGKEKTVAVEDVSMTIHEGQITALLGHNGAGKTTLINMLVGMLQPTSGKAFINDLDVSEATDLLKMREMMGVCLQEDILSDHFTAKDHLTFFCHLKGVPEDEIKTRVDSFLNEFELGGVANVPAVKLSGGQKRKLCVAIALIGDPKIIFLDEPSSGLDPYSRQKLWTFLKKFKEDRVIVLTTHFMDEADILADWKVVISKGKLQCAGSSHFLKNRFGIGYHLTLEVKPDCDKTALVHLVEQHIPTASCTRTTNEEMSFVLPLSETARFGSLFRAIEKMISDSQYISHYGIDMTTLEEVFLRLGEEELEDEVSGSIPTTNLIPENEVNWSPSKAQPSLLQAFIAFFRIRMILFYRNPGHIVPIVILPAITVIFMYFITGKNVVGADKPVQLSSALYNKSNFYLRNLTGSPLDKLVTGVEDQGLKVFSLEDSDFNNLNYSYLASVIGAFTLPVNVKWTWLFNDTHLHSLPIIQNVMSNAFFKSISETVAKIPELKITSHPLPQSTSFDANIFTILLIMAYILPLIAPQIAVEVVEDRELKVKDQLRVSGLGFFTYYNTILLTHILVYLIAVLILIICVVVLRIKIFDDPVAQAILACLFLLNMPVSLLACYALCYIFDKHHTAKNVLPVLISLVTMVLFAVVIAWDMTQAAKEGAGSEAVPIHYVFCFLWPFYAINGGMYFIMRVAMIQKILTSSGLQSGGIDAYLIPAIYTPFIAMLTLCVVIYLILPLLDLIKTNGIREILPKSKGGNTAIPEGEDDDVKDERQKVMDFQMSNSQMPALFIKELRKEYISGNIFKKDAKSCVTAVQNVSLMVEEGNIFGLLGPNGAGKSSVMKIIVGQETPTCGKVFVSGEESRSTLSTALKYLGYCPQENGLWRKITIEEHLKLYAAIRGVPPDHIETECTQLIANLGIEEHAKKQVKDLSGGTKRKVNFAVSTFGTVNLLLLDEPSTGMDPQSKRFFWNFICGLFPSGGRQSAVLTTHSMEEAAALCTRIGIMVKGSLRCLGSTQHLRNKYGGGYILDIKLSSTTEEDQDSQINKVVEFIKQILPVAELMENFSGWLSFSISQQYITTSAKSTSSTFQTCLADVFENLENAKSSFNISEYSLRQTTLDQVFLRFAKAQD